MKVLKLGMAVGLSAALIGGAVVPAQAGGHNNPHSTTVASYQAKLVEYIAAKEAVSADPTNVVLQKKAAKSRLAAVKAYKSAKKTISNNFKATVATTKKKFKATSKTVADRAIRDAAIAQASADRDAALAQLGSPPTK